MRVSIIIPTYCVDEAGLSWFNDCLASLADQDCDVVVCDDGSPVDITDVIRRWRVTTYVKITHGGVSAARNAAARYAETELILPLDCDDYLSPDAVSKMLSAWDGTTPVYPDVCKFGDENIPHFVLLDFACENITKHVGFSSVNVLHSKDQWRSIGGWDEKLDFYEDGEYNARLFSRYCGIRYPEPLVHYRMHPNQRTKQYKTKSAAYARNILSRIRRFEMACKTCGGARKSVFQAGVSNISAPAAVNVDALPGEMEGRVLVQYIGGKGKARHYYNGYVTRFPYKVEYNQYLYVDPRDAREASDTSSPKMFIRVVKPSPPPPVMVVKPVPVAKPAEAVPQAQPVVIQRTPRLDAQRTPVEAASAPVPTPIAPKKPGLPDISNMTVRDILGTDFDPRTASRLLAVEKRNKNRAKVVAYLLSKAENV